VLSYSVAILCCLGAVHTASSPTWADFQGQLCARRILCCLVAYLYCWIFRLLMGLYRVELMIIYNLYIDVNGRVTVFILVDQHAGQWILRSVGRVPLCLNLLHDVCALGYQILSFRLRLSTLRIPSSLPFPFSISHFQFS